MRLGRVAGTILAIGNITVAYSSDAVPDLNIERYCNYTADRNQVEPGKRGAFVSRCKIEDEAAIPMVNSKWQFVPTNTRSTPLSDADVALDP